jgi:hypothetical protein
MVPRVPSVRIMVHPPIILHPLVPGMNRGISPVESIGKDWDHPGGHASGKKLEQGLDHLNVSLGMAKLAVFLNNVFLTQAMLPLSVHLSLHFVVNVSHRIPAGSPKWRSLVRLLIGAQESDSRFPLAVPCHWKTLRKEKPWYASSPPHFPPQVALDSAIEGGFSGATCVDSLTWPSSPTLVRKPIPAIVHLVFRLRKP